MKIAIIGTGIAGNTAAYLLAPKHDVTVFEAASYVGGHTHTHDIVYGGESQKIDTGFIVFNKKTYPNFLSILDKLNVEYQPSDMSFSVQSPADNLEYNGSSLNQLFAQRRNLLRPKFLRMIKEILRFNQQSTELLQDEHNQITLGDYLSSNGYHWEFIHHYIIPMGAAIWSTDHQSMLQFPARFFVRFFHNHGMLSVDERPQWYVIKGGSRSYLTPLIQQYKDRIRLNSPVESVDRFPDRVVLKAKGQEAETFDAVFIASHSDQALAMLANPGNAETDVLSAIPYTPNEAVLHTDESLLPKRKLAWATWNYHCLPKDLARKSQNDPLTETESRSDQHRVALTYNMNILQSLQSQHTYCVTLNNTDAIDPKKIIKTIQYSHPFFSTQGVDAQKRHREINGSQRTYYCGAYWRFGFHEDGVISAQRAVRHFIEDLESGRYSQDSGINNAASITNPAAIAEGKVSA